MLSKFSIWDYSSKCLRVKLQQEKRGRGDYATFPHLISLQRGTAQNNPTWKRCILALLNHNDAVHLLWLFNCNFITLRKDSFVARGGHAEYIIELTSK